MQCAPSLRRLMISFPALVVFGAGNSAYAEDDELARQLSDRPAGLIGVPFQLNYDHDIAAGSAGEWPALGMPPVDSLALRSDQNAISLSVMPIAAQDDVYEPSSSDDQFAIGDLGQGLFLSPEEIGTNDFVSDARPAFALPIATDDASGGEERGTGPSAAALERAAGRNVTDDFLSFAEDDKWADIDVTFAEPSYADAPSDDQAFSFNTDTGYEAEAERQPGPTNFEISKSVKIKAQPVGGGTGGRVTLTFQFPTPE